MGRLFEELFKKMAVELSYVKESVLSAAQELDISADLLSKKSPSGASISVAVLV